VGLETDTLIICQPIGHFPSANYPIKSKRPISPLPVAAYSGLQLGGKAWALGCIRRRMRLTSASIAPVINRFPSRLIF